MSTQPSTDVGNSTTSTICGGNCGNGITSATALMTAQVRVKLGSNISSTRALLDDGSQQTFVLNSLVRKLGAQKVANDVLSINGFIGSKSS